MRLSDIVSVHAVLTNETRHLIGGLELSLMKPTALLINCADGTLFLGGLVWSRWDRAEALAGGVATRNDCASACRFGHLSSRRVVVRLYRPRTCSNGRREFTRLMFTYVGGGRGATLKSPFYTGRGCP